MYICNFENISQYKSFKIAVKGAGSIIQIIHYKNYIAKKILLCMN